MILGAQLYTVRKHTATEEGIRETFRRVRELGYDAVQLSAIGKDIPPELLAALSREYALPITCTHTPLDRILKQTDRVIWEHQHYGCTQIGLGCMPEGARGSLAAFDAFLAEMEPAVEKIRKAGLTFAYHNHAFEFEPLGDTDLFEELINKTDWNFILDTYWVAYGGRDPREMLRRLQGRILNLHFKDMKTHPKGEICPVGEGVLDFASIVEVAEKTGVCYGLVEQDNAPDLVTPLQDEFDQMQRSLAHLRRFIPPVVSPLT